MMVYRVKNDELTAIPLKHSEMVRAHEICLQNDFEQDFVDCYQKRCADEIGLCNLPADNLMEQRCILEKAYACYQDLQDCNVAYNDTLNMVIDEIEKLVANDLIMLIPQDRARIAVIIEGGIISAAYSSSPNIQLEIIELDDEYASIEERDAVYESYSKDTFLTPCDYALTVPGYMDSTEMEVE